MSIYFGFALADSMFIGDCTITRRGVTPADVPANVISCLNPSHVDTIAAMEKRYGLKIPIPEKPPVVTLGKGDSIIVMGVRGLPRMAGRHEYTEEEIAGATFAFTLYTVA